MKTHPSMTTDYTISKAVLTDVPELNEVVHAAYRRARGKSSWTNEDNLVAGIRTTPDELRGIIASHDKAILKAVVTDTSDSCVIHGCVMVEDHGDGDGYIGMLSVDPDQQSSGLGKKLLQHAEEFARVNFKSERIIMWILEGRPELQAWYERMGYKPTGEREPFPGPECGTRTLVQDLHFTVLARELSG